MNVKQAIEQLYAIPAEDIKGNDTLAIVIVKEEIERTNGKLFKVRNLAKVIANYEQLPDQTTEDVIGVLKLVAQEIVMTVGDE